MDIITRKQAREQGLTRFYTGKPCKRGHDSERQTSSGICCKCHCLRQKTRYLEDPEFKARLHARNSARTCARIKSDPEYRRLHYERVQARKRRRDADSPGHAILTRLRSRLRHVVANKAGRTKELLGCTIDELLLHLESQFVDGMSWENRHLWHVDHIRPCASFDLTDPGQQKECFHYTNLQPLWAKDNLSKSARLDWEPAAA